MSIKALSRTNFQNADLFKRGKVRDVYNIQDKLLVVSTDRISCFDVVLPTCIPDKGSVLTRISMFWFRFTKDIIPNHFLTSDIKEYPPQLKE